MYSNLQKQLAFSRPDTIHSGTVSPAETAHVCYDKMGTVTRLQVLGSKTVNNNFISQSLNLSSHYKQAVTASFKFLPTLLLCI
jgi:hypothetical protein